MAMGQLLGKGALQCLTNLHSMVDANDAEAFDVTFSRDPPQGEPFVAFGQLCWASGLNGDDEVAQKPSTVR
jgi:hypothetical protein